MTETINVETAEPIGTTGIHAPLVTGETPGPVLVATEDGQCIMVQIQE